MGRCRHNQKITARVEWMVEIKVLQSSYDPRPNWNWDIDRKEPPTRSMLCPFDTEGYLLTKLEVEYSWINGGKIQYDGNHSYHLLRRDWMSQIGDGDVYLDHAWLLERKGFDGAARKQIESWCGSIPIVGKLLGLQPRWGFSVSLDHADAEGNLFEIFSHSFGSSRLDDVESNMARTAKMVSSLDWKLVARDMLKRRAEWMNLPVYDQRSWKHSFVLSL